ncbi:putative ABC transport system permease protein [Dyella sp. SG562]|uniref:ABC transporter permease n=1 Tax=Dyella sp. SG562 TaxID=2587017 RepID=UPI00141D9F3C|nr:FtsX-like permease family protein [Dyella sp. SG562]NII71721.1 putative ABC transport system permease protein [Dyella sp. SG562]
MEIQPILAALRKHRLATLLIALEIALACAVLCNACFLIANRMEAMRVNSGVEEASLATLQISGFDEKQASDVNARMLAGLRTIPGVQSASVLNSIPFGEHRGRVGITTDPEGKQFGGVIELYLGGPGSAEAMGLKLVAGRALQADDYQPFTGVFPSSAPVLMARELAEHLWPGADPLGKVIWVDKWSYRVVGIVDHLATPAPDWAGRSAPGWSAFVPAQPGPSLAGSYLIKAPPADLDRVLRDARALVAKVAPDTVLDQEGSQTIGDLRAQFFQQDRIMAFMLVGVIVALLLVTALGIVGLASFWVQQRRKQIGIRRAIGATRGDILRYFQTENFLIVSGGIGLGMVMAFGLNLALMKFYELPHLPLHYLPIGAAALWTLGQIAVLGPALRAAAVPPVVATRSG